MPKKPDKIKRAYVPERKSFDRAVDNSWFYNSWKWRKFSKQFKRRNPLCIECLKENIIEASTVCDHKEQYGEGINGWDLNNLKDEYFNALCDKHHNSRSGKQAHGLGDMGVDH